MLREVVIEKYLESIIGYTSKSEKRKSNNLPDVSILTAEDVPYEGTYTLITLGLSEVSTGLFGSDGIPIGIEILISVDGASDVETNILERCILDAKLGLKSPKPGEIYLNAFNNSPVYREMKHVLITYPLFWAIKTLELSDLKISWVQAVPISDAERLFIEKNNFGMLEDLFEKAQIDVFDLNRRSIL